ncbi:MAG TPA: ABC transporter ATP-binding protein [Thermomicrobiales bacterium]|nr:ABC transporter ATP-binding protein [Thermomicrobiales bacterium]
MAEITFDRVSKRFGGQHAVRNLSLTVRDRELLTLVGPSGCGKSTTLNMLAGLEDPSEGLISIDGRVVNDVPSGARDIAMVFQSYALYPHMTVRQNIGFGLEVRRLPKAEIGRRVDEAAKLLDIDHLLDRRPRQLSGGQRQRVALGRALTRNPKAFLLDEPLSNLDAQLRTQMRAELKLLFSRIEGTVVYVTHDQAEAMTLSDRLVVMRDGEVQQAGAPLDVYNNPVNTFVARFLGSPAINLIPGRLERGPGDGVRFVASGLTLSLAGRLARIAAAAPGSDVILGIRPEDFSLTPPGDGVPVRVDVIEPMGSLNVLYASAGPTRLVATAAPDVFPTPGSTVGLTLAADKGHLFAAGGERAIGASQQT